MSTTAISGLLAQNHYFQKLIVTPSKSGSRKLNALGIRGPRNIYDNAVTRQLPLAFQFQIGRRFEFSTQAKFKIWRDLNLRRGTFKGA
jgi:hypothetical protein